MASLLVAAAARGAKRPRGKMATQRKRPSSSQPRPAAATPVAADDGDEVAVPGGVVDARRIERLTADLPLAPRGKSVVYWMARDMRVQDNWALLHARDIAAASGGRLHVVFCLVPKFLEGTMRHADFMLKGLQEVETELKELNIPFELLQVAYGGHGKAMVAYCRKHNIGTVVCDMSPLRVVKAWQQPASEALGAAGVCCLRVDAHNIVPVWQASNKQEVGARTIRSKITIQYGEFFTEIPKLKPVSGQKAGPKVDWDKAYASLEMDKSVKPVEDLFPPGGKAARRQLAGFCKDRLKIFAKDRNDPTKDAQSGLGPYLRFGQISAQRCALEARRAAEKDTSLQEGCDSFLEESIIRRELSDNFCWYQPHYDSLKGAAGWAQETLQKHAKDKREYLYTPKQFEEADTHDDLWNAAQLQMVREGKMHGFLRMYWAKKILEWSPTPEEALKTGIRLNDRYSLDGRDPNGYVGVMWSICGIHDMGWAERKVFGKIRFMNYAGCKRKFNVPEFVARYTEPAQPVKKRPRRA